ncbi:hypothetical protein [Kibdelosporangium phytohabitans]|uniref:Minor tail protein n=1 Tax=Kibdelosporangium phytohabitans TaxID=860235 RepID=A0A0N9HV94_9PSEU|nr:hypothetical protein [Kibdelosporangium phytohabitans]ALG06857.1 hypothetical protein AOZ06_07850 [Kibdelosporangium phytohabitans]MBE1468104.1 hypothetical protein [Kibdelosporangium phytohabitans]
MTAAVLPAWRVFITDTRTGRVVDDLPYLDTPRYEYGINTAGGWGIRVPIGDTLSAQDLDELSDPWRFSIGVAIGNHIAQMGPLVGESYNDDDGLAVVDLSGGGIWNYLTTKRLLVTGDVNGTTIKTAAADVVFGPGATSPKGTPIPPANQNLSLHTIAKRMLQISMARTNGALPILLPADIAGTAEREYPGYDLAYLGERLMQVTQVEAGPEIEFRPRYVDETRTFVQWEMRIGTPAAGGRLGNLNGLHQWEYGKALVKVHMNRDGSQQTHTRYERGAGMERDLLLGYAADSSFATTFGWPLLEDVGGQHTSATEQSTLDNWAAGAVNTYKKPVTTWTAVIRLAGDNGFGEDTTSPSVFEFAVGDTAIFQMKGHRRIRDGRYLVRILSVAGDSRDTAKLNVQLIGEVT